MHSDIKKVLVTGAKGFLGSFVTNLLLSKGYKVLGQYRGTEKPNSTHQLLEWVGFELTDIFTLEEYISKVDAVVHCAAQVSFSTFDANKLLVNNVEITKNVVNACITIGTKKLIHISSIAALSGERNATEVFESDLINPEAITSAYGKSKYLSELEVWRGIEEGLNATVLNPAYVLGPGDFLKGSSSIFKYVLDGGKYFTKGLMSYVDVRDVALAILVCIEKSEETNRKRYLLSSGYTTYEDFFKLTAEVFGTIAPAIELSPRITTLASYIFKPLGKLFPLPQQYSVDALKSMQRKVKYMGTDWQGNFGFKPKELKETLLFTFKEYKERAYIKY